MKELVVLVEGEAKKHLLDTLLPRSLPADMRYRVIPFQGKQDMEKRVAMKIRAYQNPCARFIILRHQDSHPDCRALKQGLVDRCGATGKLAHCLVRIACTELETFYLADLAAVGQTLDMPHLFKQQSRSKFRQPDALGSPSRELKTLTQNRYEKRSGSRMIGRHLALDNDRSPSFKHFVTGIRRFVLE